MTRVSGSFAAASRTSDSVRSAWLPSVAKNEKPSRRARAQSRIAVASAPECERNAMPPASGMPGAKVALSRREGRIQPRQFGPSTRMGCPRSQARSSASRARPASPASRNPAEITTAPRTPLATHSFKAGRTAGAGTAITARSTGPSIARSDGVAGNPWTTSARGFTGQMRPSNPAARRLATTLPPTFPGSREAPMTATLRGAKKAARSSVVGRAFIGRARPSRGRFDRANRVALGITVTRPGSPAC